MKFNKHNVNTYNTSIQTINLIQDLISKCIILIILVFNNTFFKNTHYYRSTFTFYEQILRQIIDSLLHIRLKTYMLLFSIITPLLKELMKKSKNVFNFLYVIGIICLTHTIVHKNLEELRIRKVVPAILLNLTFSFRMRSIYEPAGTSSTILFPIYI